MNYNQNTFVISVGEHLAAISYGAPWINNQPLSYGQACLILSAVHEELFNEMFSWSKIDNSVEQALKTVYHGYEILVPAQPKAVRRRGTNWELLQSLPHPSSNAIVIPQGGKLPLNVPEGTMCVVHGGLTYSDWLANYVETGLRAVKVAMETIMKRHMGTALDYEWWFEYAGNGILYTRQARAISNFIFPEIPETEAELINQEIGLMSAAHAPALIELNRWESVPDGVEQLKRQLPTLLMNWYNTAMNNRYKELKIRVTYINLHNFNQFHDYLLSVWRNYPLKLNVISDKVSTVNDLRQVAQESLDRNMLNKSIIEHNRDAEDKAAKLTVVRDRIVKRNKVTNIDMGDIQMLAPELQHVALNQQDILDAVNDRRQWYKFNEVNPIELDNTLIPVVLAIGNHIDTLNGNVPSNTPIPVYKVHAEKQPLAVIPLYGRR